MTMVGQRQAEVGAPSPFPVQGGVERARGLQPPSTDPGVRESQVAFPLMPRQVTAADVEEDRSPLRVAVVPPSTDDAKSPLGTFLRAHGLQMEVVASLAGGFVAGAAVSAHPVAVALSLGAWAVANFHRGHMITSPLSRQLKSVLHSAFIPLAGVAAVVGYLGMTAELIPTVFAAVLTAVVISLTSRLVRWRLRVPVRAVLVGDRLSIAQAAARWARTPDIQLVGGLLIEPDLDEEDIPRELLGSPIAVGLERAAEQVVAWAADTVLVAHGPGMTPTDFRRLAWSLESTGVSMGVVGVLESVAPHRITAGGLERETIMDVRPPRPSRFVRVVKFVFDRVAAVILLVTAAPLLALSVLAVRVDSRGPALFKQTRVGLHGREFVVYKIRTMIADADAKKAQLSEANQADAVLFKMKADPRITRVGRLLRKTSLDELPQLWNVLKGEMSLVGPRPHLPSEIAAMDSDTLRRLAVRPGITGLWQVSGRSDLPFGMASELDTYYADNWTLSGDLFIGMRTVKAVATTKGAY
jgi:exopolysaccharide biosynthesis polyprenyl glycosylphosphotransferase